MSNVDGPGGVNTVQPQIDSLPSNSVQFLFAKLQLTMSEICKKNALDYMDQIQQSQDEQKQVSAMLQQARSLQNEAKVNNDCTTMPDDMKAYMDKNSLTYDKTGNDNLHNEKEWDVAIQSLQARLDGIGSNTQQLMVFVQDYMGQYNSYLQGANSAIQQGNQTLGNIAQAR